MRNIDAEDDALSDIMRIETIGKSVQGRPLLLVRLGAAPDLPSVYVICRQHGDEAAPTEAAVQLIREFVQNPDRQELLGRVALCIVPIANPDGADAYKRANARGVNLNRDWQRQTQPETRAIARSIARANARLVIDAHENYPWEPWGAYLEAGRIASGLLSQVAGAIVREAEPDHGLRRTRSGGPATLAHRHFSVRGIPALLLESQQTSEGGDLDRRQALHRNAIATAVRTVASALPGLVFPRPSTQPPPEETPRRLDPPLVGEQTLDVYELSLGLPQLIVDQTASEGEKRFYRAQGLTWLVLTRTQDNGQVSAAALHFAPAAAKTWQDALRKVGIGTDGVTAEPNPDGTITLGSVRTSQGEVRGTVRWLPPTDGDGRLEIVFADDGAK